MSTRSKQLNPHTTELSFLFRISVIFVCALLFIRQWNLLPRSELFSTLNASVGLSILYKPLVYRFSFADLAWIVIGSICYLMNVDTQGKGIRKSWVKNFFLTSAIAIVLSLLVAFFNQVPNPLNGVRPLIVVWLAYNYGLFLISKPSYFSYFLRIFLTGSILVSSFYLINYFIRGGEWNIFLYVPLYDGGTLNVLLLANAISLLSFLLPETFSPNLLSLSKIALPLTTIILITSFSRTMWICLIIQILSIYLLRRKFFEKGRRYSSGTLKIYLFIAFCALLYMAFSSNEFGSALQSRLKSINVFNSQSSLELGGNDNVDHINDLRVAWDEIQKSPILGTGVAAKFDVNIFSYKDTSVGVHNAILTIWMWFGFLGVILWTYLPFKLFRGIGRDPQLRHAPSARRSTYSTMFMIIFASWFFAQFVLGLFFTAWFMTLIQCAAVFGMFLAFVSSGIPEFESLKKSDNEDI